MLIGHLPLDLVAAATNKGLDFVFQISYHSSQIFSHKRTSREKKYRQKAEQFAKLQFFDQKTNFA